MFTHNSKYYLVKEAVVDLALGKGVAVFDEYLTETDRATAINLEANLMCAFTFSTWGETDFASLDTLLPTLASNWQIYDVKLISILNGAGLTLEYAKELKRLEIAGIHNNEMTDGFEHSAKTYNANPLATQTLQNAIDRIANPATLNTETFDIYCGNLETGGFAQSNSSVAVASGTTISVTLSGVAAGSVLVFAAQWKSDENPSSVSDGTNNFELIGSRVFSNGQSSAVYFLANVSSGSKTVTLTLPSAALFKWAILAEFTGRDTVSPVLGIAQQGQASPGTAANAISSGVLSAVSKGCALYGITFDTTGTTTHSAGTGWTYDRDIDPSNEGGASEYQNNVIGNNYAATFTQTNNNNAITHVVALKPGITHSIVNHTYSEAQAVISEMYAERDWALGLSAAAYAAIDAATTIPDVEAVSYY